jgi:putative chitinase
MSTETVAAKMGAGKYAQPLEDACIRFGIVTPLEKAHFLA